MRWFHVEPTGPAIDPDVFEFDTTRVGTFPVLANMHTNGHSVTVDWGDGNIVSYTWGVTVNFNYTFTLAGTKRVKVTINSGMSNLRRFSFNSRDITFIDIRAFNNSDRFECFANPFLTSVWMPLVLQSWDVVQFYQTSVSVIDLTLVRFRGAAASFTAYNNIFLTDIIIPSSTNMMSTGSDRMNIFRIEGTNYFGTLDMTGFVWSNGTGNQFLTFNSPIAGVNFPASPLIDERINDVRMYGCPNLTSIIFPYLTRTQFLAYGNAALEEIVFTNPADLVCNLLFAYSCPVLHTISTEKFIGGATAAVYTGSWTKNEMYLAVQTCPNLTEVIISPSWDSANSALRLQVEGCNITGILDLSMVEYFSGSFLAGLNPNMAEILFSSTATAHLNQLNINRCTSLIEFDARWVTKLGHNQNGTLNRGAFVVAGCTNLETIHWPTAALSPKWNLWEVRGPNERYVNCMMVTETKVTEIDLSQISGAGYVWANDANNGNFTTYKYFGSRFFTGSGETLGRGFAAVSNAPALDVFDCSGHSQMTQIEVLNNPATTFSLPATQSMLCNQLRFVNFAKSGALNLAAIFSNYSSTSYQQGVSSSQYSSVIYPTAIQLSPLGFSYFFFQNNPNLTNFDAQYQKSTANSFGRFDLNVNAFNALTVDRLLHKINALVIGAQTAGARLIIINGGTNAAPTDGSITGFNGIAAKAALISKGITVTTN